MHAVEIICGLALDVVVCWLSMQLTARQAEKLSVRCGCGCGYGCGCVCGLEMIAIIWISGRPVLQGQSEAHAKAFSKGWEEDSYSGGLSRLNCRCPQAAL